MARGFIDGEYQDGELRGCVFIAGQRGMGKTTEMDRLLTQCAGGVIFFDSLSRHESVLKGYKLLTQPGELIEYLRVNRNRRFRVLYQPRTGDPSQHFHSVCVVVRAVGSMIFAVDELDMHCGAQWGDRRMDPGFYDLVNYGRHYRVSLVATARRPTSVARGFTSQCVQMRLFGMREQADVRYFQEFIGQSNATRVTSLEKFQYLLWFDGEEARLCGGRK